STVVTLIWLRLGSADIALAEAGLGGGLLGAVLVLLAAAPRDAQGPDSRPRGWTSPARWAAPVLGRVAGAALVVVLSAVWLRVEQTMPAWSAPLASQMPIGAESGSGVTHEITGVLLAFRAYDTLLESAVLMIAAVAALSLRPQIGSPGAPRAADLGGVDPGRASAPAALSAQTSALVWLVRVTVPVLLLVGLWLLFAGSTDSGGAFQSAAVLTALLILLRAAG